MHFRINPSLNLLMCFPPDPGHGCAMINWLFLPVVLAPGSITSWHIFTRPNEPVSCWKLIYYFLRFNYFLIKFSGHRTVYAEVFFFSLCRPIDVSGDGSTDSGVSFYIFQKC